MGDDVRDRLAQAAAALAATDAQRTEQQAQRDALLREAREQGVSWEDMERLSGLSRPAVWKALRRA